MSELNPNFTLTTGRRQMMSKYTSYYIATDGVKRTDMFTHKDDARSAFIDLFELEPQYIIDITNIVWNVQDIANDYERNEDGTLKIAPSDEWREDRKEDES